MTQTVTQSGLRPQSFPHVSSKPRVPEELGGRPPWTKLSVSPNHSLSAIPSPTSRDLPLCPCQAVGSSGVGGGQTPSPTPSGCSVWGQALLNLEECGFLPQKSRIPSVFTQVYWEPRGLGGNTLGKVRPILQTHTVKSPWAVAHQGPCILTTPTWERSLAGSWVGGRGYSTAARPVVLPGSRWTPGARGVCASPWVLRRWARVEGTLSPGVT